MRERGREGERDRGIEGPSGGLTEFKYQKPECRIPDGTRSHEPEPKRRADASLQVSSPSAERGCRAPSRRQSRLKKRRRRSLTSESRVSERAPSSRRTVELAMVIRRCRQIVDGTRSPIIPKSGSLGPTAMSVSSLTVCVRLVMKATTIWR